MNAPPESSGDIGHVHHRPDIAIVGVPKAGTSSLFYWLASHPQIQGTSPKETFFFMDPGHPLFHRFGKSAARDGLVRFDEFFVAPADGRLRLDGTTHHFYQRTARDHFTAGDSTVDVIFVMREPADRILSSFNYTRDNLAALDPKLTFNRFVDVLLSGEHELLDRHYFDSSRLYVAKRDLELSRYVEWIDWWRENLAPERLHLVLFEELRLRPGSLVARLCDELGLDARFFDDFDFSARNETIRIHNHVLHRALLGLTSRVPRSRLTRFLKRQYLHWQRRPAVAEPAVEEGLARLREHFTSWNEKLSSATGLDIEQWWGPESLGHGRS